MCRWLNRGFLNVLLLHSFIHVLTVELIDRLYREFAFMSQIQIRGYSSVLGVSFVTGLRSFKVGEIFGNVDNDMGYGIADIFLSFVQVMFCHGARGCFGSNVAWSRQTY